MSEEYIKRAAVEEFITAGLNNPDKEKAYGYDAVEILAEVHFMDAADVAPVVHGRWQEEHKKTFIPVEYDEKGDPILHDYVSYRCSLCRRIESTKEPYCHCGAKMDGGADNGAD